MNTKTLKANIQLFSKYPVKLKHLFASDSKSFFHRQNCLMAKLAFDFFATVYDVDLL